jgi:SAM-dependent methyltransferase
MHSHSPAPTPSNARKRELLAWAEALGPRRNEWIKRNRFYYEDDVRTMRFLVPEGLKVLDLGCGTGRLLAALKPSVGVGVDLSPAMIEVARAEHPHLAFVVGDIEAPTVLAGLEGPFDIIVLSDTIGFLIDCEETLRALHPLCGPHTRIVVSYFNRLWEPVLGLARRLGQRHPVVELNWLGSSDIANLLTLAGFEVVKGERRQLLPKSAFGLGRLVNRWIAPLPVVRSMCLRTYMVARPRAEALVPRPSVSVIVPCRNERGNIEAAVSRMPAFCDDLEIVFVEGHSGDGTWEECLRVQQAWPKVDIKCLRQPGVGKGDAVRVGFAQARGDVLMILDADLTMPPEALPKFYRLIASGEAEFVNGSRLVYPMQQDAMRFLNYLANWTFARLFTYLLNQRFTDTLCGTKVVTRQGWARIVANRSYFGDFDPFGDFDLIFGAAKLNMKIAEVPIRYASRSYGETQISRFRHGWLLLRMVVFAFLKLKAL